MALSAFGDKSAPPSERELAEVLGASASAWRGLLARLAPLTSEWSFSAKTIGWGLRVMRGDRMILSMIPRDGAFLASFALGERVVAKLPSLPANVQAAIDSAPRYAEGRGVRIEVRDERDVAAIAVIAQVKIET